MASFMKDYVYYWDGPAIEHYWWGFDNFSMGNFTFPETEWYVKGFSLRYPVTLLLQQMQINIVFGIIVIKESKIGVQINGLI
jgi:hypothetical protein